MKRVAVSLTAHESLPCLVNKIYNLRKYLPHCLIVVHIAQDWRENVKSSLRSIPDVYINRNSYPTAWGYITHCHESNFYYLLSKTDFDCFTIDASNTLIFKYGLQEWFDQHDCAYDASYFDSTYQRGQSNIRNFNFACLTDEDLNTLLTTHGWHNRAVSTHEGSFYSTTQFDKMCCLLKQHNYDLRKNRGYPIEEYIFPTLYYNLYPNATRGYPFVCHWHQDISIETISYLLHDPVGRQTPCFGIKRVPRDIYDPVRCYITYTLDRE